MSDTDMRFDENKSKNEKDEDENHNNMIENEKCTQVVENTSCIYEKTNEAECVNLLEQIFAGNYLLLPLFAQCFISYLNDDINHDGNPRAFAHGIATKGMFILQKAHEFSRTEESKLKQSEDELGTKHNNDIFRDLLCFSIGCLYVLKNYHIFFILLAYLLYTHDSYKYLRSIKLFWVGYGVMYLSFLQFTYSSS